jgi:hypothetical protein
VADNPVRATLAGILLFIIGIAIGGGAFENYRREREQLLVWNHADGQVMQLLTTSSGMRPVVGFTTVSGDRIRFTASGPGADRTYRVGDPVAVLYPIVDPSAARIDVPARRWARSIYAGIGSVLLMVLGSYVAWSAGRRGLQ